MLDKAHSQLMYKKIEELRSEGNRGLQTIKSKQGTVLMKKYEVMERWTVYVEELFKDKNRGVDDIIDTSQIEDEVQYMQSTIRDLPKEKACGSDNISAELLQCMGEKGIQIMTRLINKIYKSGYIPEDFRESIFVPISKVSKAQECGDFRTIALISHASKVLLHLIKRRITPIIERQLGDSQMGIRKGKGTRDAIFQLRMISGRITQMNKTKRFQGKKKKKVKKKKIYLCFVDYQKAFDRVRHDKLAEVMVKAGIPDLERRLIINLYWRQHAAVRWDGEVSREVGVERGVRQGCVISPMLFNLYSEFMIQEAMEGVEGIGFGGGNITNLRYADDAVLVAEKRKKMQKMIDRLRSEEHTSELQSLAYLVCHLLLEKKKKKKM